MGTFVEHINQSKSNLDFLAKINENINNKWDWQVTVCFYSALHLINAHIVNKTNKNYITHNQVSDIINPYNQLSVAKLNEETYLSYTKLLQLSRRSRYLINENFKKENKGVDLLPASFTFSKYFQKSIYHLDLIMQFININYGISFETIIIECIDTKNMSYKYFKSI